MGSLSAVEVVVVIPAALWVLCAIQVAASAWQRGHQWAGWLVCGLLLGPLAWCFAMSLTDYRRAKD